MCDCNQVHLKTIHLLGSKDEVAKAKAELETLIKQLNETVETKVRLETQTAPFSPIGTFLR